MFLACKTLHKTLGHLFLMYFIHQKCMKDQKYLLQIISNIESQVSVAIRIVFDNNSSLSYTVTTPYCMPNVTTQGRYDTLLRHLRNFNA